MAKDTVPVQLTGSSVTNGLQTRELWTPLSIINTDAGSNKVITVPAGKEYWIKHIYINMVDSTTAGNRTLSVSMDTGTSVNIIASVAILPLLTASQNVKISMSPNHPKESSYDTTARLLFPLPDLVLSAGERIAFADAAVIDPANDSIKYYIRVLQRSV